MTTLISFETVYLLALGLHVVLDFLFKQGSGLCLSQTGTLEAGLCVIPDYSKNIALIALFSRK